MGTCTVVEYAGGDHRASWERALQKPEPHTLCYMMYIFSIDSVKRDRLFIGIRI